MLLLIIYLVISFICFVVNLILFLYKRERVKLLLALVARYPLS